MSITPLDFAEPFYTIELIENEPSYKINEKSMVVNIAEHDPNGVRIGERGDRVIPPLKAIIAQDITIYEVTRAFVVIDVERTDITDPETTAKIKSTWKTIYEMSGIERHKGLPYYKSPKFKTGEGNQHLELNFCYVDEGGIPSGPHREHDRDFDEVHAQIAGWGMMRIYDYDDKEHVHEDLNMAPGVVHEKMFDKEGKYPWHEYKSVTPCVYCPIELDRGTTDYHPTDL